MEFRLGPLVRERSQEADLALQIKPEALLDQGSHLTRKVVDIAGGTAGVRHDDIRVFLEGVCPPYPQGLGPCLLQEPSGRLASIRRRSGLDVLEETAGGWNALPVRVLAGAKLKDFLTLGPQSFTLARLEPEPRGSQEGVGPLQP